MLHLEKLTCERPPTKKKRHPKCAFCTKLPKSLRRLVASVAGFAIFRVHDSIQDSPTGLQALVEKVTEDVSSILSLIRLEFFKFFHSPEEALKALQVIGTPEIFSMPPFIDLMEKQLLPSLQRDEVVLVTDEATAVGLHSRFGFSCISSDSNFGLLEILRSIRFNLNELMGTSSLKSTDITTISSMAQVLVMLTMAKNGTDVISQLDIEAQTDYKNLQEWYGWHFPELAQLVMDPVLYCRIIRIFGLRQNYNLQKLESVLGGNAELAHAVMAAAAQCSLPDLSPEDTKDVQRISSAILLNVEQKQQVLQLMQQ